MSVSAEIIRDLAAIGLSSEQMADVVGVFERAEERRRAAKREGNRERQRRSRMSRDVTRDEVLQGVTECDTLSPKEKSPTPPKEITPIPSASNEAEDKPRKRKGSRVDGFSPDVSVAVGMGMNEDRARFEADKFVDFWKGKPGQSGVKLDWPATWRNWIRSSLERNGPSSQGNIRQFPRQARPPSGGDDFADFLTRDNRHSDPHERTIDGYATRR